MGCPLRQRAPGESHATGGSLGLVWAGRTKERAGRQNEKKARSVVTHAPGQRSLTRELIIFSYRSSRVLRLRVNASTALQQLPRALMRLRGPSGTRAHRPRVDMGSTRPVRRSSPLGYSACTPSSSRSRRRPSMNLRSSSELDHRDPAPSRRLHGKSDDTSSPGLAWPYDTISGRRIRLPAADPSATACRVRGLATPCATYTTGPPDASSASEHPWASPFKGFPSSRSVLLSEPMPSWRYPSHSASPEGCEYDRPTSGPSSRDESVLTPKPQVVPAVDPFVEFAPPELAHVRLGVRFGSRRLPPRPWAA